MYKTEDQLTHCVWGNIITAAAMVPLMIFFFIKSMLTFSVAAFVACFVFLLYAGFASAKNHPESKHAS